MPIQARPKEFDHKLLEVRRTARVVAGGRRFSFRTAVVAGNHRGRVGIGVGKGPDVQSAVNRAVNRAVRSLLDVPLGPNGTIAHAVEAKYAAAKVFLRPAAGSRGMIVGGVLRAVCELAGIPNIVGKVLSRTGNKINIARATLKALAQLKFESRSTNDESRATESETVIRNS